MPDRTIKSKNPWFKYFSLPDISPPDDLAKARAETLAQLSDHKAKGKSIRRKVLK
jgi:hypothetical protein